MRSPFSLFLSKLNDFQNEWLLCTCVSPALLPGLIWVCFSVYITMVSERFVFRIPSLWQAFCYPWKGSQVFQRLLCFQLNKWRTGNWISLLEHTTAWLNFVPHEVLNCCWVSSCCYPVQMGSMTLSCLAMVVSSVEAGSCSWEQWKSNAAQWALVAGCIALGWLLPLGTMLCQHLGQTGWLVSFCHLLCH